MLNLGQLGCNLGKGLLAGIAGTAVLTALSMAMGEKEEGQRAHLAGKALGFHAEDKDSAKQLSQMIHWEYGAMWGGIYGVMRAVGIDSRMLHFAAVWGTAAGIVTGIGGAPPPHKQPLGRVLFDGTRHLAFSLAVGAAFDRLTAQGHHAMLEGPGPVLNRAVEQPYLTSPVPTGTGSGAFGSVSAAPLGSTSAGGGGGGVGMARS